MKRYHLIRIRFGYVIYDVVEEKSCYAGFSIENGRKLYEEIYEPLNKKREEEKDNGKNNVSD